MAPRNWRDHRPPRPKSKFVYTLASPSGDVFYVGMGTGDRAEQHLVEAEQLECFCKKCRAIHRIWSRRQHVVIAYVFETDDRRAALAKETELIKSLAHTGKLTNKEHVSPRIPQRSARAVIQSRIQGLEQELSYRGTRKARRAEIMQELSELKQSIGDGWQRSFDLLDGGDDW